MDHDNMSKLSKHSTGSNFLTRKWVEINEIVKWPIFFAQN